MNASMNGIDFLIGFVTGFAASIVIDHLRRN